MLTSLQVKNFAIIDLVEVEFSGGMTVLTGETGAGKSILVDALGLVLGERGSSGLVRKNAARAEFTAEFDIRALPHVGRWLQEQALDSDGECLLRRVVSADSRSRAFVNGNAVPLQVLKTLGEMLLDIHGQHIHQSLGRAAVQRDLLDHFASTQDLRSKTESAFTHWQALAAELAELQAADADRASRLDLLTFQTSELNALDLQESETTKLLADRQRLQNSGQLADGVSAITQLIYESETGNAQSLIADACQRLQTLCRLDSSLAPVVALLAEADIQIGEAADSLRRYGDSLDMDPAERDRVEERLDAIQTVARKHRVEVGELATVRMKLEQQLDGLIHAEERSEKIAEQTRAAEEEYRFIATKLSKVRHKAAIEFSGSVTAAMANLGMTGGKFLVSVTDSATKPRLHGIDNIEYLISANPGQQPMPLSKVASGGELSRMSLSIQVIASDGSDIPTMVFDEVDSGVGGGIAEMVGQRLRDLGHSRQVLCVTHLPQVASLANNHFRVLKISDGKTTRTAVSTLGHDERVEELARMLGGVDITERTRDHATEMLQSGISYKGVKSKLARQG